MSKQEHSRSGEGHPLLTGILVGMVLGLLVAGGVAWYLLERPSPYTANVPHDTARLEPDGVKPPPPAAASGGAPAMASAASATTPAASAVRGDKPRFEFYQVLTDGKTPNPPKTPAGEPSTKPAAKEALYLQAGAFSYAGDADQLKAHLAMLGMEATVLDSTLPDKTELHRVRLGPYKTVEEMNAAFATLKQNGIVASPTRAQ